MLYTTPLCNCRNKANCPLESKCRKSSIIYKATLKSNGITDITIVAVKLYLKPVSTTTNKALSIDKKEMPRNCRRLSGMPKTPEQIPSPNVASRPKLVHINREQNRAISVLPRNSLFYNSAPPQRSIKDHSLATNDATKTS